MREGQDAPKLRLKNGVEVDARKAYVDWRMFVGAEKETPAHVQALVALARGDDGSVPSNVRLALQSTYEDWFASDGSLLPLIKDVVLSAFRDTPDGPVIVNPFQLTSQADAEVFDRVERRYYRILRWFFGNDNPPGQAR